jgi:tryptophan synthase alpha chain
VTPTSDANRLPAILAEASGFIYYVSVLGITGTKSAAANSISDAYQRIRAQTDLPIVAGFGIRTPQQAAEAADLTDGAVVGSAVVDIIANNLTDRPANGVNDDIVQKVATFVGELATAIRK